jgi:hypothetical protein
MGSPKRYKKKQKFPKRGKIKKEQKVIKGNLSEIPRRKINEQNNNELVPNNNEVIPTQEFLKEYSLLMKINERLIYPHGKINNEYYTTGDDMKISRMIGFCHSYYHGYARFIGMSWRRNHRTVIIRWHSKADEINISPNLPLPPFLENKKEIYMTNKYDEVEVDDVGGKVKIFHYPEDCKKMSECKSNFLFYRCECEIVDKFYPNGFVPVPKFHDEKLFFENVRTCNTLLEWF